MKGVCKMAYKVFLGVGHGGTDTGAVADGYREKDMTLAMALACQEELARHGVLVRLSRTKDENDPVNDTKRVCTLYISCRILINSRAESNDNSFVKGSSTQYSIGECSKHSIF